MGYFAAVDLTQARRDAGPAIRRPCPTDDLFPPTTAPVRPFHYDRFMTSSHAVESLRPPDPNSLDALGPALERTAHALGRSEELLVDVPPAIWDRREAVCESRLAGESLTLADLLEDLAVPEGRSGATRSSAARRWLDALWLVRAPTPEVSPLSARHWHAVSGCLMPDGAAEDAKGILERQNEDLRVLWIKHGGLAAASMIGRSLATANPSEPASRLARLASHALLHHAGLSARAVAPLAVTFTSSREEPGFSAERAASAGARPCVVWLTALQRALAERRALVRTLIERAERDAQRVAELPRCATSTLAVLAQLRKTPVTTLTAVSHETRICFPTTLRAMQRLLTSGIVREITGRRSKRVFAYDAYVRLLEPGGAASDAPTPPPHATRAP